MSFRLSLFCGLSARGLQLQLIFIGSVLECVQMGAAFGNIYVWFVTGFGNFDNLNTIHRWAVARFLTFVVAYLRRLGWTW
jgi:hypothetical protein